VHNKEGKTITPFHRPADLQRDGEERIAKRTQGLYAEPTFWQTEQAKAGIKRKVVCILQLCL